MGRRYIAKVADTALSTNLILINLNILEQSTYNKNYIILFQKTIDLHLFNSVVMSIG